LVYHVQSLSGNNHQHGYGQQYQAEEEGTDNKLSLDFHSIGDFLTILPFSFSNF
jgi:hypothetical protein